MTSLLDDITKVSPSDLIQHPDNPRRGDVEAIAESLEANGQFQPLVVQRSTSHILAGNHTHLAILSLGWDEVDVVYVDVDDDAATRILLAANRTSDLGEYDEIHLAAVLGEIREADEEMLIGTGYTAEIVDEMLANVMLIHFEEDDEDRSEEVDQVSAILNRLMPEPGLTSEKDVSETMGRAERAAKQAERRVEPDVFVVFRFGELRAKVTKDAYEQFVVAWIAAHGADLGQAGVDAAVALGVPVDAVSPAVANGTERWL